MPPWAWNLMVCYVLVLAIDVDRHLYLICGWTKSLLISSVGVCVTGKGQKTATSGKLKAVLM